MKIPYKHIVQRIDSNPDIQEISDKLFQLGHEHEIFDEIFNIEFTPNRGDCISLEGMLRDLKLFYNITNKKFYNKDIPPFSFNFLNGAKNSCKDISFVKLEIDSVPTIYKNSLEDYMCDLGIKKINFFTDISNYLLYETGQPTHCYDASRLNTPISLGFLDKKREFKTLLDNNILVDSGDLVFCDNSNEIINLAGVVGGKNTACKKNTNSVIIECAYFDPEAIIGRSLKYDINSDAAYKFERNTDPNSHDYVLRRFLKIVEDHCNILNVQLFKESNQKKEKKIIPLNYSKINKILGIKIHKDKCLEYLEKLGFIIHKDVIEVPSYRNDISSINDLAEEVARANGYDNIERKTFKISCKHIKKKSFVENKIKKLLVDEGFNEVINNPFVIENINDSVLVDNPLDSNKKYLRFDLKSSLIDNLIFNERRQKDSIKLFEISDIYSNSQRQGKKVIGIIASGRVGKNYVNFPKKINSDYLYKTLCKLNVKNFNIEEISRDRLNSKSKNRIFYCEIVLNLSNDIDSTYKNFNILDINDKKYTPISEYPCSKRDLSFSIKDFSQCKIVEKFILNFKNDLIKEVFVFDYYNNQNLNEIKIGFRFIFQSNNKTVTDEDVENVMKKIIKESLLFESVSIPGLL